MGINVEEIYEEGRSYKFNEAELSKFVSKRVNEQHQHQTELLTELLKKDQKIEMIKNHAKMKMAFMTQRIALETFFKEVLNIIMNNTDLEGILTKEFPEDTKLTKRVVSEKPSMSDMNRILAKQNIKNAVWKKMDIPKDIVFPHKNIPGKLLYGFLSNYLHDINEQFVYVSNEAPLEYRDFFYHIAAKFGKVLDEYSEEEAAGDKEL